MKQPPPIQEGKEKFPDIRIISYQPLPIDEFSLPSREEASPLFRNRQVHHAPLPVSECSSRAVVSDPHLFICNPFSLFQRHAFHPVRPAARVVHAVSPFAALLSGLRSYPVQQPFAQALPVGTSSCRTVPTAQRSQLLVQSHRQWNVMSGHSINNSASIVLSDQPSHFNGHVVLLSDQATSTAQASIIRSIAPSAERDDGPFD